MIDANVFLKIHPSYARLQTQKQVYDIFGQVANDIPIDRIKSNDIDPNDMNDDNLAICSPTLLGYSLNEKSWGKL
jgi:hypothetical protein